MNGHQELTDLSDASAGLCAPLMTSKVILAAIDSLPTKEASWIFESLTESLLARHEHDCHERDRLRPFNLPHAKAKFSIWARKAFWTPSEMTALLLGKDPGVVTPELVEVYILKSPFARDFFHLLDDIERCVAIGRLPEKVSPADAIEWATARGMTVDASLIAHVRAFSARKDCICGASEAGLVDFPTDEARAVYDYCRWLQLNPTPKGKTDREHVEDFLAKNAPGLLRSQKQRIVTICNRNKNGGRPPKV
jgi:hypothetical protein